MKRRRILQSMLILVLIPLLGCGQRGRVSTGYSEGLDPEGNESYTS